MDRLENMKDFLEMKIIGEVVSKSLKSKSSKSSKLRKSDEDRIQEPQLVYVIIQDNCINCYNKNPDTIDQSDRANKLLLIKSLNISSDYDITIPTTLSMTRTVFALKSKSNNIEIIEFTCSSNSEKLKWMKSIENIQQKSFDEISPDKDSKKSNNLFTRLLNRTRSALVGSSTLLRAKEDIEMITHSAPKRQYSHNKHTKSSPIVRKSNREDIDSKLSNETKESNPNKSIDEEEYYEHESDDIFSVHDSIECQIFQPNPTLSHKDSSPVVDNISDKDIQESDSEMKKVDAAELESAKDTLDAENVDSNITTIELVEDDTKPSAEPKFKYYIPSSIERAHAILNLKPVVGPSSGGGY